MEKKQMIKVLYVFLLVSFSISTVHAYTYWYYLHLNITNDKPIYVNVNLTKDQQDRVADACKAWYWTGAKYRPFVAGTTTRPGQTRDGVCVFDNSSPSCLEYWVGQTWFTANDGSECDIRINIGRFNFYSGPHWSIPLAPTLESYQACATHELGHLMGLWHSSEEPEEPNAMLKEATMYYTGEGNTSIRATLGRDDICGIITRTGGQRPDQWQIAYNPGYDVRLPRNDNQVDFYIDPKSRGTTWGDWVIIRKPNLGAWLDKDSRIEWQEYDKAQAAIITLGIIGVDGVLRVLYYARNAPEWYTYPSFVGWPDLSQSPAFPVSFYEWVTVVRSLWDDYRTEFGVNPAYLLEFQIRHFVNEFWQGDHGCSVKEIYIRGAAPY